MTISLILTGGTICSRTAADGLRRCDVPAVSTVLEQRFRAQHPENPVQFAVQAPLNRLSEDLTPADWLKLLDCIAETDLTGTDGMMILHGTDTLHQTAAMLSAALAGVPVPVVLVSACSPPGEPDSNADANFAAAVSLIQQGLQPGVWAVYRNTDGKVWLHRGCELEECSRSADFHSPHMCPAEHAPTGPRGDARLLSRRDRFQNAAEILLLMPYNGMRYDRIPLNQTAAVLHATYHSGTANSSEASPYSVCELLRRCKEAGTPCYLAPCVLQAGSYSSTAALVQQGAIPLDMPLWFAYSALWLGALCGLKGDSLTKFVTDTYQRVRYQPE